MKTVYSEDAYRNLIQLAITAGYEFIDFGQKASDDGRFLFLRHDVDYSLSMALRLAKINHSLGVQGTFCVLLRSQIYNILSYWGLKIANEIIGLDQNLALHYVTLLQ